jgi:hypothetical protein
MVMAFFIFVLAPQVQSLKASTPKENIGAGQERHYLCKPKRSSHDERCAAAAGIARAFDAAFGPAACGVHAAKE